MRRFRCAVSHGSEIRPGIASLAAGLLLIALSACGGSGAAAGARHPSASPSASASTPVSDIPTSSGVCAANAPVPGCTELGDPYGAPPTCHVTVGGQLAIPRSPADKLPSYGYGKGPVYLSGQNSWFAAGQETLFLIDSAYTGAVRISGQLAGSAAVAPIFIGSEVSGPDIVIPSGSVSPYWRFWDGQMSFAEPGCYTLTFQRKGADDAVTLYVHSGSPPPG